MILYLDFDGTIIPELDENGNRYIDWNRGFNHIYNRTVNAPAILSRKELFNYYDNKIEAIRFLTMRPESTAIDPIADWCDAHNFFYNAIFSAYPYINYDKKMSGDEEFCWHKALVMNATSHLNEECRYHDGDIVLMDRVNAIFKQIRTMIK